MIFSSKEFDFEKENNNQGELDEISQGINRIRFIQGKINHKANFIHKLLSTQRSVFLPTESGSKQFITSLSTLNSTRGPRSELRSHDQSQWKGIKEKKLEMAEKIKLERKQIKATVEFRRNEDRIKNMFKKMRVKRCEETGKTRIQQFKRHHLEEVQQFKNKTSQQMNAKITLNQTRNEKYLQKLEMKVLFGEKIREYILEKSKSGSTDPLKHQLEQKEIP